MKFKKQRCSLESRGDFIEGVKQLTELKLQCRKARIPTPYRAILAWTNLKELSITDLSNHLSIEIQWLSEYLIETQHPLFPCSLFDPTLYLVSLRKS